MSHPIFGTHSRACLASSDTRLVILAEEALRIGMDFKVIWGHRNQAQQEQAFAEGATTKHWPRSKHNTQPSLGIDVAPWPINWKDTERFYHLIGIIRTVAVGSDIPIRCGLDWDNDFDLRDQTFMDLGHIEIIGG